MLNNLTSVGKLLIFSFLFVDFITADRELQVCKHHLKKFLYHKKTKLSVKFNA